VSVVHTVDVNLPSQNAEITAKLHLFLSKCHNKNTGHIQLPVFNQVDHSQQ